MRILYTGTLNVNAGGPAFSTYHTMKGLNAIGVKTELLGFEFGNNGKLIGTDVPMHFAKRSCVPVIGYSDSIGESVPL